MNNDDPRLPDFSVNVGGFLAPRGPQDEHIGRPIGLLRLVAAAIAFWLIAGGVAAWVVW